MNSWHLKSACILLGLCSLACGAGGDPDAEDTGDESSTDETASAPATSACAEFFGGCEAADDVCEASSPYYAHVTAGAPETFELTTTGQEIASLSCLQLQDFVELTVGTNPNFKEHDIHVFLEFFVDEYSFLQELYTRSADADAPYTASARVDIARGMTDKGVPDWTAFYSAHDPWDNGPPTTCELELTVPPDLSTCTGRYRCDDLWGPYAKTKLEFIEVEFVLPLIHVDAWGNSYFAGVQDGAWEELYTLHAVAYDICEP